MSVHRFIRSTEDADLATAVELPELRRVVEALHADGLKATLRTPDEDDELGGVITVWIREDEDGDPIEPVEIINFVNPWRRRRNPATEGIRTSTVIADRATLRCVGLAILIALKLDAGAPKDLVDVSELLQRNRDANLDEIRAVAERYGLADRLALAMSAIPAIAG